MFCSGIVGSMLADVSVEFIADLFVELVVDMLADCVMHLCAAGVVVQGSLFARGDFMLLWGTGSTHFQAILNTAAQGNPSAPVDLQYLKKV